MVAGPLVETLVCGLGVPLLVIDGVGVGGVGMGATVAGPDTSGVGMAVSVSGAGNSAAGVGVGTPLPPEFAG